MPVLADTHILSLISLTGMLALPVNLLALDAAIRRKHGAMLLWCGLTLALDVQGWLLAPFVIAVSINSRIPPARWLLAPLSYTFGATVAPMLPHTASAPGIWAAIATFAPDIAPELTSLALTSAAGAAACYVAHFSARMPGEADLPNAALLSSLITAGLLPHMPASGFLLASLLAVGGPIVTRDRRDWIVAALALAGSISVLASALLTDPLLAALGLVAMALATWRVARPLLKPAANDNPLMMRTLHRAPLHGRATM